MRGLLAILAACLLASLVSAAGSHSAFPTPQRSLEVKGRVWKEGGAAHRALLVRGGNVKSPQELYANAVMLGEKKAAMPSEKIALLSLMSGIHISLGALLAITIGGNMPGVASVNPGLQKLVFGLVGLPLGLLLVLVCGGELFTGNTALIATAVFEGKATVKNMLRNWSISWTGNLIGSLLMAKLIMAAGLCSAPGTVAGIAAAKTSFPFMKSFLRGIICNFLVCTAVWMATGCTTLLSKYTAISLAVGCFVSIGAEHSVANMFLLPLGMFNGATVTWGDIMLKNILPVTLGNIIGGSVVLAGSYAAIYGSLLNKKAVLSS